MKDEILAAYHRIAPFVRQTPLEYSAELGAYLKLEHWQHTGSFKFRGASNKIALLTAEQAAAGVVTASKWESRAGGSGRIALARHRGGSVRLLAGPGLQGAAYGGDGRAASPRG